jgi:serine/threonine protein kinase
MADLAGQQFGNYSLLRKLGAGTFGEVYLGEHVYLRILAAIKILPQPEMHPVRKPDPQPSHEEIPHESPSPRPRRSSSRVIGIDFGTTNSCMAIIEGGEPIALPPGRVDPVGPLFVDHIRIAFDTVEISPMEHVCRAGPRRSHTDDILPTVVMKHSIGPAEDNVSLHVGDEVEPRTKCRVRSAKVPVRRVVL